MSADMGRPVEANSESTPLTIFVGGSMRSGTTVLQRILCSAPGTNPLIAECQYLTLVMDQYASMAEAFDVLLGDYFDSPQAFAEHVRARAEDFLRIAAERYRPTRALVLKSPELTRRFPILAGWFPDARFIIMMRDPRDAIASMLDVAERHRQTGHASTLAGYGRDMAKFVTLFRSYYRPLARDWAPLRGRSLILRYEDLATDPEAALQRLAGFTGLELNAAHLVPTEERISERLIKSGRSDALLRSFVTPLLSEPMQASHVGRYRELLSPEEIQYIEQHCGDIAASDPATRYW